MWVSRFGQDPVIKRLALLMTTMNFGEVLVIIRLLVYLICCLMSKREENDDSIKIIGGKDDKGKNQKPKDKCEIKKPSKPTFYLYQVSSEPCTTVNVKVNGVSDSTIGWLSDLVGSPNVYLLLDILETLNDTRKTPPLSEDHSENENEVYRFYIPQESTEASLEVKLMQRSMIIGEDTELGTKSISLKDLTHETKHEYELKFTDEASVTLDLELLPNTQTDIRFGKNISEGELEFLEKRKSNVGRALENMEGMSYGNRQAPVVALLGSGGGYRAMIGFSGVYKALYDTGLIDVITYTAAISGSTWWQSFFYTNAENGSAGEIQQMLKKSVCNNNPYVKLLYPSTHFNAKKIYDAKTARGHPTSFTDVYGVIIRDILLKDQPDLRLSDHQEYVSTAEAPFPIYASVLVNKEYSALERHQWLEWNPYEVSLPQWNTQLPVHAVGSDYYLTRVTTPAPEVPLHYLQATWGNAFAIHLPRIAEEAGFGSSDGAEEESEPSGNLTRRCRRIEKHDMDSFRRRIDENLRETNKPGELRKRARRIENDEDDSSQSWLDYFLTEEAPLWRSTFAGYIPNPLKGSKEPKTLFEDIEAPTTQEGVITSEESFLTVVDAGVALNIPFTPLLDPERQVDIFLAFDFSSRQNDEFPDFTELVRAEEWATLHGVFFPTIASKVEEYKKKAPKEYYIFKGEDSRCPVIIFFMIFNGSFREFKHPGVPRETEEEKEFADFQLFSSASSPYSTFNFDYEEDDFERLAQMMEYNTLLAVDDIKKELQEFKGDWNIHGQLNNVSLVKDQ